MNGGRCSSRNSGSRNQEYWGRPFRPKTPPVMQNFREVWFAGVHGDIGGGYPEAQSGAVKIPLAWMIEETQPAGLIYVTRTVNDIVLGRNHKKYVPLDPTAPLHDSMTAGWKILEYVPRRVPENSWRMRGNRNAIYLPAKRPSLHSRRCADPCLGQGAHGCRLLRSAEPACQS